MSSVNFPSGVLTTKMPYGVLSNFFFFDKCSKKSLQVSPPSPSWGWERFLPQPSRQGVTSRSIRTTTPQRRGMSMGTEPQLPTKLVGFTSRVEETPPLGMSTVVLRGPTEATASLEATASSEVPASPVPGALGSRSPQVSEPRAPAGHSSSGDSHNLD